MTQPKNRTFCFFRELEKRVKSYKTRKPFIRRPADRRKNRSNEKTARVTKQQPENVDRGEIIVYITLKNISI